MYQAGTAHFECAHMVHRPKCGISDPKVWTQPPLRNSYQLLNKKVRGLEKQRDLGAVLIQEKIRNLGAVLIQEKIRNLGAVLVPENRVLDQLIQNLGAIQDLGLQGLRRDLGDRGIAPALL